MRMINRDFRSGIKACRLIALMAVLVFISACDSTPRSSTDEALTIETASIPSGTVSQPYMAQLVARGGTGQLKWSISSGNLPPGFTLDGAAGIITGIPTATGDYAFTVSVQSGNQVATRQFTLRIGESLALVNWYLRPGFIGEPYSYAIEASGGIGEYTFSITDGALPEGLSIDANGVIHGIPNTPGSSFFKVTVASGSATVTRTYALTVSSNSRSGFNIAIVNGSDTMLPKSLLPALNGALALWERAIISDFGEHILPILGDDADSRRCRYLESYFRTGEIIEDLALVLNLRSVDGPKGTLGSATICGVLDPKNPYRLFTGSITLDLDDLPTFEMSPEGFQALLAHELAHLLGFNEKTWFMKNLIIGNAFRPGSQEPDPIDFGPCGEDPRFIGTNALAAYRVIGGTGDSVPIQGATPGDPMDNPGICDNHWDESTFGDELMSAIAHATGSWPLSIVTLGAMEDMGYSVNYEAAAPFVLPTVPTADIAAAIRVHGEEPVFQFKDDVRLGPMYLPSPDGTVIKIVPSGSDDGED